MASESPIAILTRWTEHGAQWRALEVRDEHAVVELLTCYGEPVDRLESDDPELIEYLRREASAD